MAMDPVTPWMWYNNLDDVPVLCKSNEKAMVSSKLLLSKEALPTLELHLSTIGLDTRRFNHTVQEQHKLRVMGKQPICINSSYASSIMV